MNPFPWHALPRVGGAQVRACARVRRVFPSVRRAAIVGAVSALVGHAVELDVRRVGPASRVDLGSRGPLVVLGERGRAIAIELEAELALALVGALAGARIPKVARGRRLEPEAEGALAGLLSWLARELGIAPEASAVLAIGPDELAPLLGLELLAIDATVRLGMLRSTARVAVSVPELDRTPVLPPLEALHRLGDTPLSLPVVIGVGLARAGDLRDLGLGDVVVVDQRVSLLVAPTASSGALVREVAPEAGFSRGRVRVRVEGSRGELAAATAQAEGETMIDETGATMQLPALEEGARLAEDLAELPLAVRVEIGDATLAAREWAALGPGDVLVLDRRVGDPVSLRIGGRVLARGELVEIDGALGVRITERTT